jgi:hypothetical protein
MMAAISECRLGCPHLSFSIAMGLLALPGVIAVFTTNKRFSTANFGLLFLLISTGQIHCVTKHHWRRDIQWKMKTKGLTMP